MLCVPMVFETWMIPLLTHGNSVGGLPDTSWLRLLRLVRLSRMMRLLKYCPELVTLLKGMGAAVRSVSSTLMLLVAFMYVFAIIFRQQAREIEPLDDYFGSMGLCFWTLLLQGTLLDNITAVLTVIKDESVVLAILFLLFMLLGNLTIMNMLIGVLCEVVSAVGQNEKEKRTVQYAKDSFMDALNDMDRDGSGTISQEEFVSFVNQPSVAPALDELGVDREGLLSFADEIFSAGADAQEEENAERERQLSSMLTPKPGKRTLRRSARVMLSFGHSLSFGEVLEHILTLRSSNTAMVKDIVDLRKFIRGNTKQTNEMMMHVVRMQQKLMVRLDEDQSLITPSGNVIQKQLRSPNLLPSYPGVIDPGDFNYGRLESVTHASPEDAQRLTSGALSPPRRRLVPTEIESNAFESTLKHGQITAATSDLNKHVQQQHSLCSISESEVVPEFSSSSSSFSPNQLSQRQPSEVAHPRPSSESEEHAACQNGSHSANWAPNDPASELHPSHLHPHLAPNDSASELHLRHLHPHLVALQAEVVAALDEQMDNISQIIRKEVLKVIEPFLLSIPIEVRLPDATEVASDVYRI
eukprot:gnl/MRDRNA2_/MRDRNA2_65382_c0_seq3.p1 gnl/MRDRNA2_/MRDRNA2_65382_c0~~gnl/MRDRNA2_/MRDRNA2_65382_c0_seq3.p1  ORF type:complete len:667 (+),score=105.09 gnl/MRDRNA2_/MRDRNA2_65382_c0_seq3:258-2003(+)